MGRAIAITTPTLARFLAACALGLVLAGDGVAQQANSGAATLKFNGFDGWPYPIDPASLPRAKAAICHLSGVPNAPFILASTGSFVWPPFPALGGLVDLNLQDGLAVALDGLANPAWHLGGDGYFIANVVVPASTPIGTARCWQGAVINAVSPSGVTLTASTRTVVVLGLTTIPLLIGSNSYAVFNLTPFQSSIPFYGQLHATFFISQDGAVSFNSGFGDFTPSDIEMLTQMPRIAGYWTDLEPGISSSIDLQIDQSFVGVTSVTARFLNLREWAGTGRDHSFMIRMFSGSGDLEIISSVSNQPAQYDVLVGISPGGLPGNVFTYPWTNLGNFASSPLVGAVAHPIYEWYGLPGFPYYTPAIFNPYDLTGRTLRFSAIDAGTAAARYAMVSVPTVGF